MRGAHASRAWPHVPATFRSRLEKRRYAMPFEPRAEARGEGELQRAGRPGYRGGNFSGAKTGRSPRQSIGTTDRYHVFPWSLFPWWKR